MTMASCVASTGVYGGPAGGYQGGYASPVGGFSGPYTTELQKDIKTMATTLKARCQTRNGDWHRRADDFQKWSRTDHQ